MYLMPAPPTSSTRSARAANVGTGINLFQCTHAIVFVLSTG